MAPDKIRSQKNTKCLHKELFNRCLPIAWVKNQYTPSFTPRGLNTQRTVCYGILKKIQATLSYIIHVRKMSNFYVKINGFILHIIANYILMILLNKFYV